MARQDIAVIGASSGGVEALKVLVSGFPADLPAAIFVVLHIGLGLRGESYMASILSRAGSLPAVFPAHGEAVEAGKIYIAPPDYHILLEGGCIRLSHGPKENRTRPAINPLFRSAANSYGGRVIGVILTGELDDGVSGLAEIKRRGGVAIVQDPQTAPFPAMPYNALRRVNADYVVPLSEISRIITQLAITERNIVQREEPMERKQTNLTCPECRGPLSEERQGEIVEYRCRVGHVYTPLVIQDEHRDTVERSLWATIVALNEAADIAELLAPELGPGSLKEARQKRQQAAALAAMFRKTPG